MKNIEQLADLPGGIDASVDGAQHSNRHPKPLPQECVPSTWESEVLAAESAAYIAALIRVLQQHGLTVPQSLQGGAAKTGPLFPARCNYLPYSPDTPIAPFTSSLKHMQSDPLPAGSRDMDMPGGI